MPAGKEVELPNLKDHLNSPINSALMHLKIFQKPVPGCQNQRNQRVRVLEIKERLPGYNTLLFSTF